GQRRRVGAVPAAAYRTQLGRHDRRVRVGGLHAHQESQRKKRAGGSGQGHEGTHTRWTRGRQPAGADMTAACTCVTALRGTTAMTVTVTRSVVLFVLAGLCEIGGGWLMWQWLRGGRPAGWGVVGAAVLVLYGIVPTLQPASFGRTYATYGGF